MAWSRKTFIDPPTLKKPVALLLFIINIFFPGKSPTSQNILSVPFLVKCEQRGLSLS